MKKLSLAMLMVFVMVFALMGCDFFSTQFTLTIEVEPAEAGEVLPESGSKFDEDAMVDLEVTAAEGFKFSAWAGADGADVVEENGNWQILMDDDKSIVAEFVALSTDANLLNLQVLNCSDEVVDLTPEFDPTIFEYETAQVTQHGNVKFVVETSDPNALVTVNGDEIAIGEISRDFPIPDSENDFEIVVTAEDGLTELIFDVLVNKSAFGTPCD